MSTVIAPAIEHETVEAPEQPPDEPPARGCHLIDATTAATYCRRGNHGVRPEAPYNVDGPVCDGPHGCGQRRCSACVREFHDA